MDRHMRISYGKTVWCQTGFNKMLMSDPSSDSRDLNITKTLGWQTSHNEILNQDLLAKQRVENLISQEETGDSQHGTEYMYKEISVEKNHLKAA